MQSNVSMDKKKSLNCINWKSDTRRGCSTETAVRTKLPSYTFRSILSAADITAYTAIPKVFWHGWKNKIMERIKGDVVFSFYISSNIFPLWSYSIVSATVRVVRDLRSEIIQRHSFNSVDCLQDEYCSTSKGKYQVLWNTPDLKFNSKQFTCTSQS